MFDQFEQSVSVHLPLMLVPTSLMILVSSSIVIDCSLSWSSVSSAFYYVFSLEIRKVICTSCKSFSFVLVIHECHTVYYEDFIYLCLIFVVKNFLFSTILRASVSSHPQTPQSFLFLFSVFFDHLWHCLSPFLLELNWVRHLTIGLVVVEELVL